MKRSKVSVSAMVVATLFLGAGCGKSALATPPVQVAEAPATTGSAASSAADATPIKTADTASTGAADAAPTGAADVVLTNTAEVPSSSARAAVEDAPPPPPPAPLDIAAVFSASGWMGDASYGNKYVKFIENDAVNPHSAPHSIKVHYKIGPQGWAGIYWLNKPGNWGDKLGDDLSKAGYKRITFWARGDKGSEVIELKAGGIDSRKAGKPYADSFGVSSGKQALTKEWRKYEISLSDQDLTSVIGGFCWVANDSGNPNGLTFWLDDIQFEG